MEQDNQICRNSCDAPVFQCRRSSKSFFEKKTEAIEEICQNTSDSQFFEASCPRYINHLFFLIEARHRHPHTSENKNIPYCLFASRLILTRPWRRYVENCETRQRVTATWVTFSKKFSDNAQKCMYSVGRVRRRFFMV